MTRPAVPGTIARSRIVIVARKLASATLDELAGLPGGPVVEVTMDGEGAAREIERLRRSGVTVGAGTVLARADAEAAVAAGAEFLVAPHLDEQVVEWAAARGVPFIPGAMTPTEAVRGWAAGAAAIKIFPASVVGPRFVREMRGPLGQIPLIVTGGISAENAGEFVTAGALAVAVGSWLTGPGGSIAERWAALSAAVRGA